MKQVGSVAVTHREASTTFNFDRVFPQEATQEHVFDEVQPLPPPPVNSTHKCASKQNSTSDLSKCRLRRCVCTVKD